MAQNFKIIMRLFRLHFTNKNNMSQKVHFEYFDGFYEVTENTPCVQNVRYVEAAIHIMIIFTLLK